MTHGYGFPNLTLHCTVAIVSASEAFENFETSALVEITQKHTLYKVK